MICRKAHLFLSWWLWALCMHCAAFGDPSDNPGPHECPLNFGYNSAKFFVKAGDSLVSDATVTMAVNPASTIWVTYRAHCACYEPEPFTGGTYTIEIFKKDFVPVKDTLIAPEFDNCRQRETLISVERTYTLEPVIKSAP